jgi:hypothetical protein
MRFDTPTVELHQALDQGESDAQAAACTDALGGPGGQTYQTPREATPARPVCKQFARSMPLPSLVSP